MKDVLKGVAVKVISVIVIIAIIVGGGYLACKYYMGKMTDKTTHEVVNSVEVIKEKLEATAELNTGNYLCTDVITWEDSKKFKDWKIPFTDKSFIVQYDGVVKAGIRDLTKAEVTEEGKTIIVKLPDVEITGVEIDNDSFEKLDESNNLFNQISIEDLNEAQKDLKEKMREKALEKGVLDIARSNAEAVLSGILTVDGYTVKIEWQA